MKRTFTLSLQYYYLLLLFNVACSIAFYTLFLFGGHVTVLSGFAIKILGYAGAVALYWYSYNSTYFYFRNAGITIFRLVVAAFIIDAIAYWLLVWLSVFINSL